MNCKVTNLSSDKSGLLFLKQGHIIYKSHLYICVYVHMCVHVCPCVYVCTLKGRMCDTVLISEPCIA